VKEQQQMAIDFPDSPEENEEFSVNGRTWVYNNGVWNLAPVTVQGPQGPQGPQGIQGPEGSPSPADVRNESGTTYTLVLSDDNKLLNFSNSSNILVTIPLSVAVNWRNGANIHLLQGGSGQLIVEGETGVSILTPTVAKSRSLYSLVSLIYLGSDSWLVTGDLAVS